MKKEYQLTYYTYTRRRQKTMFSQQRLSINASILSSHNKSSSASTSRQMHSQLESDQYHHDITRFSEKRSKIQYHDISSSSHEPRYLPLNQHNNDHSYGISPLNSLPTSSMGSYSYSSPSIASNEPLTPFSLSTLNNNDELHSSDKQPLFARPNLVEVIESERPKRKRSMESPPSYEHWTNSSKRIKHKGDFVSQSDNGIFWNSRESSR